VWSDALLLHWTCKWGQNCLQLLPTGRWYGTHSVLFRGRKISKDIWPAWLPNHMPPGSYLWGAVKGAVCKDKPHTLLELKEAIANFIRNISPIQLSHVIANKIRHVVCLETHGVILNICCSLSKYEEFFCSNIQGPSEYTHHLQ
jgi:hypothetical protein